VRQPGWSAWWLAALALVMAAQPVAPGAVASAEERFHFGAMELTLAAGGSFSHDTVGENVERVDGFQLLPHFGVFLTDEHGPGWVRGNFELVTEPTSFT